MVEAYWETRGTATRPKVGGVYQKRSYCPGCRDNSQGTQISIKIDEGNGPSRRWGLGGDALEEINLNLQKI